MLNAVKSVLGDVSSISPLSERRANANEGLTLEASANTLFTAFSISILTLLFCTPERWEPSLEHGSMNKEYGKGVTSHSCMAHNSYVPLSEDPKPSQDKTGKVCFYTLYCKQSTLL